MASELQLDEIPKGWEVAQLGDHLVRLANGLTAKQEKEPPGLAVSRIETISDGTVNFEKVRYVRELDKDKEEKFLLKKGDLLFSHINSDLHLGKTAIYMADTPLLHGMNLLVMRPNPETLNSKFLHYYLNLYRALGKFIDVAQHAVNQSSLNQTKIKAVPVPLPPIKIQQSIVAEIEKQFSRLDEAVASLKRVKANLKRYKAAVLKAAVEGKLTEEWRKQNPDVEPASKLLERILAERRTKWEEAELAKMKAKGKEPKNDKWKEKFTLSANVDAEGLPNLPDGWCYMKMACLVDEPKYGTAKKCSYEAEGLGVLRIPNIGDGVIDDEDLKYAKFEDSEIAAYSLNNDDLLVIRSNGSLDLVGKTALVREPDCNYLYAGYLIRLRPIKEIVSGAYLQSALSSLAVRLQIESKAKSTSGVNNINAKELKTLTIPVCSKDEQTQVVREIEGRLSMADYLLNDVHLRISKAESLRQAILASSFCGKTQ